MTKALKGYIYQLLGFPEPYNKGGEPQVGRFHGSKVFVIII